MGIAMDETRLDRLERLAESTLLMVRENSQLVREDSQAVSELRENSSQQWQKLRENMAQQWQETRARIDDLAQMIDRHTKR
jgi:uncharacterized protein YbcC (UPF0753/DUF2309 family)